MLSVIVLCGGDTAAARSARAETVVRTLSPLVQAAVRGLVRDVTLVGSPGHELALIAEHAGCGAIEADAEGAALRQAITWARSENLMLLNVGHVPEAGFFDEVEDLLAVGLKTNIAHLLRAAPETFLQRLFPPLAPAAGLIAVKSLCTSTDLASFGQFMARLRPRQTLRRRLLRIG